jgi:hypothetical protein
MSALHDSHAGDEGWRYLPSPAKSVQSLRTKELQSGLEVDWAWTLEAGQRDSTSSIRAILGASDRQVCQVGVGFDFSLVKGD